MDHDGPVRDPVAEDAVAALLSALRRLFGALPAGEWADHADLALYAAHLLLPRFSGVAVLGPAAEQGVAAAWLDELAFRELPYAVLSRPAAAPWVGPLAAAHGLTTVEREPFMCLPDPSRVAETTQGVDGDPVVITAVDPADEEHVGACRQVLADGFEAPVELLSPLVAPELLALAGVTAYVGRTAGEPCTTGLGVVGDGQVGVFNIATPPVHRNRGFGHAVTARVVADGVRAGAQAAYLQASPMGLGVYERMGFRTVETWTCFYPP
jgi:N-acetylglutamate synthase